MVFTSLPLYHLDPPNWNQAHQHQVASNDSSHHLISTQLISSNQSPSQNQAQPDGSGGGSRPGSMAERARMAKIPQPEQALKCPRCDSTNTKFCYFNNYSLSQPRHFCKTCRRYWTRGGALRNVPVGGGCRRNKRNGGGGKSSSHNNKNSSAANNNSAAVSNTSSSCSTATNGNAVIPSSNYGAPMPFLSSLHPLADHYGASLGLNFTSMQHQQHHHQQIDAGDYQVGPDTGGTNPTSMGLDQWRIQQIQQFPFFGGLDGSMNGPVTGIYPNFDGEMSKVLSSTTTSGLITQLASVKMEDNHHHHQGGMSLPRQYLGMPGNDPFLGGGNGWAGDLSGFNSSSSGNIL